MELSQFANNIRIISALKHLFSFISPARRSLQTDFYQISPNFHPKFNGLIHGLWPTLPQTYMNFGRQIDRPSDRQTDKQTNK